jgi:cation channel sperm-associated protein 2
MMSYSTFGTSVMTLFQFLTLDHWDHVNRDVRVIAEPVWTQIYIISWVWLGAFIFRGIFVGGGDLMGHCL